MTAARTPTPSPWRVEPWHGGNGYRAGFYIARSVGPATEWHKRRGRAVRFESESDARPWLAYLNERDSAK